MSAAARLDRLPILPFHRRLLWLIGAGLLAGLFGRKALLGFFSTGPVAWLVK